MGKTIVFTVTTDLTQDQRMRRIAGSLANAGYEVTLVGRLLPSSRPLEPQSFRQHRLRCWFLRGPLFYLEYNVRLVLWVSIRRFDIYGTIDADTALAGIFSSWWRQKPLVYDAHELFQELPEVIHRPLVKKIWSIVEGWAFSRATLAYTVSDSLARHFEQKYRKQVALVRNMPLRQESVALPQNPPYFIYQGALNVGRGLECAIEAMEHVPAQLVICGEGPLQNQLKKQVQDLGLQAKVIFKGNVPPAELVEWTTSAWAGIMLLENQGLSYYYSLANKFFDYVQAGIPQLCVPFPEYAHFNAQHEVAVLVPAQVESVREGLLTLLQDQSRYHQLRQNCLVARQEWCWETESQHLVNLYKDV